MTVREKLLTPVIGGGLVVALQLSLVIQILVAIPAIAYIALWGISLRMSPGSVAK